MILYHGSTVAVEQPRIISSELGCDFGFGFYTTDIREQAERWALRKARIVKRQGVNTDGIISVFEFDDRAYDELKAAHFPEPTLEWLDLVCACRGNTDYSHGYDIVTGKIANDSVGETVSYVVQGVMRREDALERLRFEQINNQVCFNTEKALLHLKFLRFEVIV